MITPEQLQETARRAMIQLDTDELPALLQALQTLEIRTAPLFAQVDDEFLMLETGLTVQFSDGLRPDCVVPGTDAQALLQNAATVQDGCYLVRRCVAHKEAHL